MHHSLHRVARERAAHEGELRSVHPRAEVLQQLDALEWEERDIGPLLHAFGAAEEPAVGSDDAQRPTIRPGKLVDARIGYVGNAQAIDARRDPEGGVGKAVHQHPVAEHAHHVVHHHVLEDELIVIADSPVLEDELELVLQGGQSHVTLRGFAHDQQSRKPEVRLLSRNAVRVRVV